MFHIFFTERQQFSDFIFECLPSAADFAVNCGMAAQIIGAQGVAAYYHPETGLRYAPQRSAQRIPTIEEAEAIIYDEINDVELLYQIQDWLGEVCQADFDTGWDHFMLRHGSREDLANTAQRMGFDRAIENYDAECSEDAAMRLETMERF
jgi:hypothetical protein